MLFEYAACHFVIVKWLNKYETGKNEINTQEDKHQFLMQCLPNGQNCFVPTVCMWQIISFS